MNKVVDEEIIELRDYLKEFSDSEIRIVGREEEIKELISIISSMIYNNPLLIGHSGVGKTAIVKGLAAKINNKLNIPEYLLNKKIYQLDIVGLLSDTKFQGELESRIKKIFEFIKSQDAIVFIDEFHLVTGSSAKNQSSPDISGFLKTIVTDRNICCIGATTTEEYRKYIQGDKALARRFKVVNVEELSTDATIEILKKNRTVFEEYYGLKIEEESLLFCVSLSSYFPASYLPEKAINLLDETCGRLRSEMWLFPSKLNEKELELKYLENNLESLFINNDPKEKEVVLKLEQRIFEVKEEIKKFNKINESEEANINKILELKKEQKNLKYIKEKKRKNFDFDGFFRIEYEELLPLEKEILELEKKLKGNIFRKYFVNKEDIAFTVSKRLRLSVDKLVDKTKENLIFLPKMLESKIKGQKEAIRSVTDAIFRSSTGIQDSSRPFASFLFIGPTGVGKTALSLAIAEQLFDKKNFLRLDMTEFSESHSISKLLGSPPGYVGFGSRSYFEFVRERKNSVILFDEIEKGCHEVINILLQIMDNGFVILSDGTEVDFRSTMIILTTNLGFEYYKDYSDDRKELARNINIELKNFFHPEFLNRLDEKVFFNSLDKKAIFEIIDQELLSLLSKANKEQQMKFEYNNEVKEKIFLESYSFEYGARPLKRFIEKEIGTLIAKGIISGFLKKRINYSIFLDQKRNFKISPVNLLKYHV